jgi:hypothetical protein
VPTLARAAAAWLFLFGGCWLLLWLLLWHVGWTWACCTWLRDHLRAGFDEGILSLCRPISLLYGESQYVQQISVTNDRAPSYENRPATRPTRGCSPRGGRCLIPHHETFSTIIQPPYSSTKGWIME